MLLQVNGKPEIIELGIVMGLVCITFLLLADGLDFGEGFYAG